MARFARPLAFAALAPFLTIVGCGEADDGAASTAAASSGGTADSEPGTTGTSATSASSDATTSATTSGATTAATASGTTAGTGTTGEPLPDDVYTLDFRVDDFGVRPVETDYVCFEFAVRSEVLAHIVGFEALVDNIPYVHHYVLAQIDAPSGRQAYPCYDIGGQTLWGWAPGVARWDTPPEAGFLVGDDPSGETWLRLQIHYNNPLLAPGQRDSSGFRLYLTESLREHDAGTFTFGEIEELRLDPGMPAVEHVGRCPASFTSTYLADGPIQVFASTLHAHETGSVLWSEHWRDGAKLEEVARRDPFDFGNQGIDRVDFELRAGDEFVNHCVYDTTDRTEITRGGVGTFDEMCWNTVSYWPKVDGLVYCDLVTQ